MINKLIVEKTISFDSKVSCTYTFTLEPSLRLEFQDYSLIQRNGQGLSCNYLIMLSIMPSDVYLFLVLSMHSSLHLDNSQGIYMHQIIFITLIIQQPFMVDFRYHRELLYYTRNCKVWCLFLCFMIYTHKMTMQQNFSL